MKIRKLIQTILFVLCTFMCGCAGLTTEQVMAREACYAAANADYMAVVARCLAEKQEAPESKPSDGVTPSRTSDFECPLDKADADHAEAWGKCVDRAGGGQ